MADVSMAQWGENSIKKGSSIVDNYIVICVEVLVSGKNELYNRLAQAV